MHHLTVLPSNGVLKTPAVTTLGTVLVPVLCSQSLGNIVPRTRRMSNEYDDRSHHEAKFDC
jgi:hypothetical protein